MLLYNHTRALGMALSQSRFEIVPLHGGLEQVESLPRSSTVTVTCSPVNGIEPTVSIVEKLARAGYNAVPHISARMVTGEDHLDQITERLTRAGVTNIYVIGGDSRTPHGPYTSAGELLAKLHRRGNPFQEIGVAGYPEGHPLIDDDRLWYELDQKQSLATYMVTQMCFEPSAIIDWIDTARYRGIALPVFIGIPGVVSRSHLLRIAARIGVGQSARFLSRHAGMFSRMFWSREYSPDDLVDELSPSLLDSRLDIQGFHVYTFNYVRQTEDWRRQRLIEALDE
jgi:methylenetetrahydrofolate reductase (NADPH)